MLTRNTRSNPASQQISRSVFRVLFLSFLTFHPLVFERLLAQGSKVIRNIYIERQDVFPEIKSKPRFLFEWANRLHIVTRESVIRQELLFEEGDQYDAELLEESERKLRALPYFGEVVITPLNDDGDSLDIHVQTQDQWSTLLSYVFNRGGGRTEFGGSVEEFNFLGFGKQIFFEGRHETGEGTTLTARYSDPQLFFSRWTTRETLVTGPFVKSFSAQIIRPFYSLDTRWAFAVAGAFRDETQRLFLETEEVSRSKLETKEAVLTGARAFGGRFKKTRLQLSYRFQDRDFSALGDLTNIVLPDDELIHALTFTTSFENLSFAEEKRIDRFVKTEDITLGSMTTLSVGRTGLPVPEGVKRFELSAIRREAHRLFSNQYLIFIAGVQTLFEKDTIASLRLQYYNRVFNFQTLAFNLEFDYAEDLETSRQFLLGGDSGLRGYEARQFTGDKRLLINLESRFFSPLNILTVALGGVVFVDAGHVWKDQESIDLRDLNYSVGFGLRLGYTKSPNSRVSRIDFGWGLNRGGGFEITVGLGQQFSLR